MIRRNFLQKSITLISFPYLLKDASLFKNKNAKALVLSTWKNPKANAKAWDVIQADGSSLDAVEAGCRVPEADIKDTSVGFGGFPDNEGNVTLDACIMDHKGNAGSVCYLQNIKHPVSVARRVMEKTPHVILAGEGALKFALEQGFEKTKLLTPEAKKAWEKWKEKSAFKPVINIENHDTIGMLAIDKDERMSGACTTSGLAFKMPGRVGDSPIIGAGLFVDGEIGGAAATGMGELVLKTLGSFLVVEFMRQGFTPQDACKKTILRISEKIENYKDFQVGFIAASKAGEVGAFSIHPGFSFTVSEEGSTSIISVDSYIK